MNGWISLVVATCIGCAALYYFAEGRLSNLRRDWFTKGLTEARAQMQLLRDGDDLATILEENACLKALLNTPEIEDFDKAVPLEAAHQVLRWSAPHDDGKTPEDWFWLLGYLAGKAVASAKNGDLEKAKHHCISSAAVLRNWHAHLRNGFTVMRPGIEEPKSDT